jgi:hypothetical protein
MRIASLLAKSLKLRDEDNTKSYTAVVKGRVGFAAISRAAIQSVIVPTATTKHTVRDNCTTSGVGLGSCRISAIPVAAPFPYIAVHIV